MKLGFVAPVGAFHELVQAFLACAAFGGAEQARACYQLLNEIKNWRLKDARDIPYLLDEGWSRAHPVGSDTTGARVIKFLDGNRLESDSQSCDFSLSWKMGWANHHAVVHTEFLFEGGEGDTGMGRYEAFVISFRTYDPEGKFLPVQEREEEFAKPVFWELTLPEEKRLRVLDNAAIQLAAKAGKDLGEELDKIELLSKVDKGRYISYFLGGVYGHVADASIERALFFLQQELEGKRVKMEIEEG